MTLAASQPPLVADGRVAGIEAAELAARFGTPVYAYDLDAVTTRVRELRSVMPSAFDLAFAVKANPLLAVLEHLAGQELGADVASEGELRHVLRAGFDPRRVVVTGPGKADALLAAAVEAGVRVVTVESRGELARLAAVAEAAGRIQPVLLRYAVDDPGRERRRIIGDAGAGKFGMDELDLRAAAADAVAYPWLDPWGVHAFGASNVLDARILVEHVGNTVDLALSVAHEAGFDLRLVDAGGGLGIPYADDEAPLDLHLLGEGLAGIAHRLAARASTAGPRVLLEPGRYLVGPAGAYVARVTDRKRVRGAEVAILDGGVHHLLRPALVGQPHRVVALTGRAAGGVGAGAVTLAGPLCTGLDIVARDAGLGGLEPGDLVAVLDAGAYGATESMPWFLSHPFPAEVVVRSGVAHLARPRFEPEAWLGTHVSLAGDEGPGAG